MLSGSEERCSTPTMQPLGRCVQGTHGSNREAESTDAPSEGELPARPDEAGNARGAKGAGHRHRIGATGNARSPIITGRQPSHEYYEADGSRGSRVQSVGSLGMRVPCSASPTASSRPIAAASDRRPGTIAPLCRTTGIGVASDGELSTRRADIQRSPWRSMWEGPRLGTSMKQLMTTLFAGIVIGLAEPAIAEALSRDIAARVEAIPIQTLTISDEQFLTGDASGKPTMIAGVLRIAQGSGRLPAVILVAGSGGFNANTDVWDRQFESMGISTFAMDSFAGRGIVSTVVDQSQLGRLNLDLYRSLAVPPIREWIQIGLQLWDSLGVAKQRCMQA
jgi:hypothetical protein